MPTSLRSHAASCAFCLVVFPLPVPLLFSILFPVFFILPPRRPPISGSPGCRCGGRGREPASAPSPLPSATPATQRRRSRLGRGCSVSAKRAKRLCPGGCRRCNRRGDARARDRAAQTQPRRPSTRSRSSSRLGRRLSQTATVMVTATVRRCDSERWSPRAAARLLIASAAPAGPNCFVLLDPGGSSCPRGWAGAALTRPLETVLRPGALRVSEPEGPGRAPRRSLWCLQPGPGCRRNLAYDSDLSAAMDASLAAVPARSPRRRGTRRQKLTPLASPRAAGCPLRPELSRAPSPATARPHALRGPSRPAPPRPAPPRPARLHRRAVAHVFDKLIDLSIRGP